MAPGAEPLAAEVGTWLPEPWSVRGVSRETADTVTLEIAPRGEPRSVRPGQFLMLYVFGVGEVPISIAGIGPEGVLRHTIRDVGAVTHALTRLRPGDAVGVRGPFGSAWPVDEERGRDLLLVAGGIGLAPLRPVLERVEEHRDDWDDVVLLYGAREPSQLLYERELDRWRAAEVQVEVTVDHADHTWNGHVGVVTTLIRRARFQAAEAAALLCGPEIMMRFVGPELVAQGVAPEHVHVSLERNMRCAVGHCGHCQLGPEFVCLDGPVLPWSRVAHLLDVREL